MKRPIGSVPGFQSLLAGMDDEDELVSAGDDDLFSCGGGGGSAEPSKKKRRLNAAQVRALEKNFEAENKLEPERKARLARELGLQPRQVAVWFQNRRARWKTKQLERDYGGLKSQYDALRLDYDSLLGDKESLLAQVKDLKAKLAGEADSGLSAIKDESGPLESDDKVPAEETLTLIYSKDGLSDSDSSAVLNDENTPPGGLASSVGGSAGGALYYQQQLMKVEDEFLDGEEPCRFFTDDQLPAMSWYFGGGWE